MKIMIAYPPLISEKGVALLGQNRQFQWFHNPTYIYPMVPAYAATILKKAGYEVVWADGIAEGMSEDDFLELIKKEKPDIIAIESKTPVIKRHWKFIDYINKMATENWKMKTVLFGDHVTALPEETMQNSKVDYILTGGDYDFLLLNLANHISKKETLEPGIWFRKGDSYDNSGHFVLDHNLNDLPMIDRDLTKWKLYAYENGNYKKTPGTYTMAGRDCWWGKCTFCSWTTIYPKFRTRTPESLLDEVEMLVNKYHIKEIMEDTGCLPAGGWLEKFCEGMIKRGLNKKVAIDCNMRVNALNKKQYELMAKAGFRFILYGLESANQNTLDRINKNIKVEDIEKAAKMAKEAGLEPHMTCMVGYPWETLEEAQKTIDLTKRLFNKGYMDTLQATVVIPYPGTPLFKYCQENNLLQTLDWNEYDMRRPIMKSPIPDEKLMELTQGIYKSFITPRFIFRKIISIRSLDDIKFLWRAGLKLIGHLLDFGEKNKATHIDSVTINSDLPEQEKKQNLLSVSVIIPTYNAGKILDECLASIEIQDYPKDLLHVIIADGGSKDNTLDIAKKYLQKINLEIINENTGSPEGAKAVGLTHVKTDLFVDIGCDNIFPTKDFFRKMVEPFSLEKNLTAAYPWRYTYRKKDTFLNRYFALFGVNDPVPYYFHKQDRQSYLSDNWTLAGKPTNKDKYFLVEYNTNDMPTLGANGFFIRTEILKKAKVDPKHYFHIDVVYDCVALGYNKFAVIKNDIIHATGEQFGNLFKKRMRYMDELFIRDHARRRYKIYSSKENLNLLKYIIISITIIEPLFQSIRGFIRKPDPAWFLHPVVCFLMTFSYGYVVIKKLFKNIFHVK